MSLFDRVLNQIPQAPQELDLLPKIEQLANTADLATARQIVEGSPALLGELASSLLLELITEARKQGNEAIAQTLEDTLALLETARSEGIEQAFRMAAGVDPVDDAAGMLDKYTDVPAALVDQVQSALALQAIYGVAGQPEDLDAAANRWRDILAHPAFASTAAGFQLQVTKSAALARTRRCQQSGQPECLSEAVALWRNALGLSGDDPAERAACLTYLGHTLRARAAAVPSGALADLDEAIASYRQVRQHRPALRQSALLTNLAAGLHARFQITGQVADLDEAIDLYGEARNSLRLYARSAPDVLDDLGSCLMDRFRLRSDVNDLDEAITTLRLAAQRTSPETPDLPRRLHALAQALVARYDLNTDDSALLDEAIGSLQAAIRLAADTDPDRRRYAEALAECLKRYYTRVGLELGDE